MVAMITVLTVMRKVQAGTVKVRFDLWTFCRPIIVTRRTNVAVY